MIVLYRWTIVILLGLFWFWVYKIVESHIAAMESVNWWLVP